jgi:hypothetical protein
LRQRLIEGNAPDLFNEDAGAAIAGAFASLFTRAFAGSFTSCFTGAFTSYFTSYFTSNFTGAFASTFASSFSNPFGHSYAKLAPLSRDLPRRRRPALRAPRLLRHQRIRHL